MERYEKEDSMVLNYVPLEFNYTESKTPFTWPQVTAPTPEDLGLEWWPTVETGYHP